MRIQPAQPIRFAKQLPVKLQPNSRLSDEGLLPGRYQVEGFPGPVTDVLVSKPLGRLPNPCLEGLLEVCEQAPVFPQKPGVEVYFRRRSERFKPRGLYRPSRRRVSLAVINPNTSERTAKLSPEELNALWKKQIKASLRHELGHDWFVDFQAHYPLEQITPAIQQWRQSVMALYTDLVKQPSEPTFKLSKIRRDFWDVTNHWEKSFSKENRSTRTKRSQYKYCASFREVMADMYGLYLAEKELAAKATKKTFAAPSYEDLLKQRDNMDATNDTRMSVLPYFKDLYDTLKSRFFEPNRNKPSLQVA